MHKPKPCVCMCSVLCTVQCVAGMMICTYLVLLSSNLLSFLISHCLQSESLQVECAGKLVVLFLTVK